MTVFSYKKIQFGRYLVCGAFAYRPNQAGALCNDGGKIEEFMRDVREIISEIIQQYNPARPDLASSDMTVELEIDSINSIKIKVNRNSKSPSGESRKPDKSKDREDI